MQEIVVLTFETTDAIHYILRLRHAGYSDQSFGLYSIFWKSSELFCEEYALLIIKHSV